MQQHRSVASSLFRYCTAQSNKAQLPCTQQLRSQTNGAGQPAGKAGAGAGINGQTPGGEEDSTPPSAMAAMATMGAGALGAVAVAAVGVWGVFTMAMAVAEGTGRTLNSQPSQRAVATGMQSPANDLLPMQPDVPAGPLYPPTPAHRKADLQAELQALYQMPKSRAVEEQKAAMRQELQALQ